MIQNIYDEMEFMAEFWIRHFLPEIKRIFWLRIHRRVQNSKFLSEVFINNAFYFVKTEP